MRFIVISQRVLSALNGGCGLSLIFVSESWSLCICKAFTVFELVYKDVFFFLVILSKLSTLHEPSFISLLSSQGSDVGLESIRHTIKYLEALQPST